jgi:hypothetical protein
MLPNEKIWLLSCASRVGQCILDENDCFFVGVCDKLCAFVSGDPEERDRVSFCSLMVSPEHARWSGQYAGPRVCGCIALAAS